MRDVFQKLIERYDYGGAMEVLRTNGMDQTDAGIVTDACRCAVNFDFESAWAILKQLPPSDEAFQLMFPRLEALKKGVPEEMMLELLEDIMFQIVNEEYIDFLGRVYRFKEAVYKYMFIKTQGHEKQHVRYMEKNEIMKTLRKHYHIYNANLIRALNVYFDKFHGNDQRFEQIISRMNSREMDRLIQLRHESPIGHGFRGVGLPDILRAYGDPYAVLEDFKACMRILGTRDEPYKYSKINCIILNLFDRDQPHQ